MFRNALACQIISKHNNKKNTLQFLALSLANKVTTKLPKNDFCHFHDWEAGPGGIDLLTITAGQRVATCKT